MKTKIKLFGAGVLVLMGVFAGANFAAAQTVSGCTAATLNGTLNTTGGLSTTVWFEWGTNSSVVSSGSGIPTAHQVLTTPQSFSQQISSLTPSTTYYYRAVFSNTNGTTNGGIVSFTTSACVSGTSLPTVTTNGASSVAQTSATLNGYETSSGANASAWFEWGTTQSYGNTTPSVYYGTGSVSFSNSLLNLSANTTYYYRAVAQNSQGTVYGSAVSFTTTGGQNNNYNQPYVTTNSASSITQTSATLNGYVTSNGTNTSAWFEWGTSYSLGNTTPSINYGTGSTSFTNSLFNLSANTTYYYRAAAQSSMGTVYGNTISFTTSGQTYNNNSQAYVTTNGASSVAQNSATLNGYVTPNGTNTSAWFEWGTTQSFGYTTPSINYGTGSTSFNNSLTNLSANTTYYYRAVAQNSQGTVYGSSVSFTTTGQTYNPNVYGGTPTVTTLLATELTGSTARLNGLVFASGDLQASSAWFEWGTNSTLGNKTQTTSVGSLPAVKHSDYITGLTRGQTYYYRVVAQNSYGTVYGGVNTFVSNVAITYVAPTVTVTNPVVLKPTTVVINQGGSTQSLATLSIEGGAEMIGIGEKRTYHVVWKNTSTQTLTNVVLRVTFPSTINVDSATRGSFSSADNSVIVDVKTLAPDESGDTFIFATTNRNLKAGDLLVVTADMVYTTASGIQGDAIAYVTHTAEAIPSVLGASVFGAGSFLPTNLFEWILLIIMVLLLVLLGNHLYGRMSDQK